MFRTRVYPIPAGGTRTVKLVTRTPLDFADDSSAAFLFVPMDVAGDDAIPEFSLDVSVEVWICLNDNGCDLAVLRLQ